MEEKIVMDDMTFDPADYPDEEEAKEVNPEELQKKAEHIASLMSSLEMAKVIVRELDNKLAQDIKLLHVEDKTILAEYFVLATANSNTQVRALCGYVEEKLLQAGITPLHTDGTGEGSWNVLDFAGVILHIFTPETRGFYNLDKLWADCEQMDISAYLDNN